MLPIEIPSAYAAKVHEAANAVQDLSCVLIAAHVNPDGDAIGSMCAASLILRALGKETVLYSPGPLPASLSFFALPGPCFNSLDTLPFVPRSAFYVDCGEPYRLGSELEKKALLFPSVNVDHHRGSGMGSMANLIFSSAASTTLLLAYLALALGIPLKDSLGEAIALGLITDTGGFSHANTDADVFALSAHLSSQGVDFAGLREHIEHCIRKEKMRLWGHLVQKVQFLAQGRIALSAVSRDDLALDNATREDTEGFVEYLRKIKDVQVACLLREEDNCVKFSLRSGAEWDVWKIADELGGGGHKNAAGGTLLQPLDHACAKMSAKLEKMLSF